MTDLTVRLREESSGSGSTCRQVLSALPGWFGIEQSVDDYAAVADRTPTVVASVDGWDVGFLTVVRHGPSAAEVHVMGVLPEFHRHGVGRQMLERAERSLVAAGVELLQVKTLSATKPDDGYERTAGLLPGQRVPATRRASRPVGAREPCAADGEGPLSPEGGTGRSSDPSWAHRA